MKIIVAEKDGRITRINADKIEAIEKNESDGKVRTSLFLSSWKCVIDGDHADAIGKFMAKEENYGMLDLTVSQETQEVVGYWKKKKERDEQ